jgi:hypothetical protein
MESPDLRKEGFVIHANKGKFAVIHRRKRLRETISLIIEEPIADE